MNIKELKPQSGQFHQGYFTPKNPEKYIGDLSKIIFRSSYELKFMQYCDIFSSIIKWSSEPLKIPYYNVLDGRMHNYNVDFYIRYINSEGIEKDYLVEIKPNVEVNKPKPPKRLSKKSTLAYNQRLKTYITNSQKFEAAKLYAEQRGMEFLKITEEFLFNDKLKK